MRTELKELEFATTVLGNDHVQDKEVDRLELEASRRCLTLLKTKLGPRRILDLIRDEVEETDRVYEQAKMESNGNWRVMTVELDVKGLDLSFWLEWLKGNVDDESNHFRAHPEHYVWTQIERVQDSGREGLVLIEPMGAGEYPLRGYVQIGEWEGCEEYVDLDCPIRMYVGLYTANNVLVYRSIAQYRETPEGFFFRFQSMEPESLPIETLRAHSEHMRLEYHRYMESARQAWVRALESK